MGLTQGRNPSPKNKKNATEIFAAESRTINRQRLSSPPNSTVRDPSQDINPGTAAKFAEHQKL
ncbi:hypothetical protein MMC31_007092, partial [Peltigera leucophlebia]|nr:hypothetical protein [Peltigera leucophlebia]